MTAEPRYYVAVARVGAGRPRGPRFLILDGHRHHRIAAVGNEDTAVKVCELLNADHRQREIERQAKAKADR